VGVNQRDKEVNAVCESAPVSRMPFEEKPLTRRKAKGGAVFGKRFALVDSFLCEAVRGRMADGWRLGGLTSSVKSSPVSRCHCCIALSCAAGRATTACSDFSRIFLPSRRSRMGVVKPLRLNELLHRPGERERARNKPASAC
jgi:hypothetical protein